MPSRLGIDVGGTFTGFLLFDEASGRTHALKTPTIAGDFAATVRRGLEDVVRAAGIKPGDIEAVVHGAGLLEELSHAREGARVGLLVTEGFEQVLHLGRSRTSRTPTGRAETGNPVALAGLDVTRGVVERVSARGNTITQLDEPAARRSINELLQAGVDALAVCLLHAYVNPAHELRLKAIIREMDEKIPVFLSHDVAAESGEFERALATVLDASLATGMREHLDSLTSGLKAAQVSPRISVVQSTGGLASARQATDSPIRSLMSGRAGGAAGAARIASLSGFPDALALDIGGTSANISLIRDGMARMSNETAVGTARLGVPSLDVRHVAGGGASIAHVPVPGVLRVGPPGSGRGAALPTVTDANVVLGRLPTGPLKLDVRAADDTLAAFGRELGLDRHRAAEGIVDIFNENIAGALRQVAIEKGGDPGKFAIVAFGGAGPVHGCALGMLTGCSPVIVPRDAGVLPALGFLSSDVSSQFGQTIARTLDDIEPRQIADIAARLGARARSWLDDEGADGAVTYRAELRCFRRDFQISVEVDPSALVGDDNGLKALAGRLADAYERRFGLKLDRPAEIVALRAIATARTNAAAPARFERGATDPGPALVDHAQVYFDGGFTNTPTFDRERLAAGNRIVGPAIVTQGDTTTVIHPGCIGEVDEYLNILILPDAAAPERRH